MRYLFQFDPKTAEKGSNNESRSRPDGFNPHHKMGIGNSYLLTDTEKRSTVKVQCLGRPEFEIIAGGKSITCHIS